VVVSKILIVHFQPLFYDCPFQSKQLKAKQTSSGGKLEQDSVMRRDKGEHFPDQPEEVMIPCDDHMRMRCLHMKMYAQLIAKCESVASVFTAKA